MILTILRIESFEEYVLHPSTPIDNLPNSTSETAVLKRPSTIHNDTASPAPRITKRRLNTLAARRYRQKRLDHISELEAELKKTQDERDALKVRVARLEGETELMRQLLRARK